MAEYIETEQARQVICMLCEYTTCLADDYYWDKCGAKRRLDDIPLADVKPVVRGKWLLVDDAFIDEVKCSNCGVVEYFEKGWKYYNFCPNCGADMRGEEDV